MNIDIKQYIRNNFKDISKDEIRQSIEESINQNDEIVLPGLGVLFNILWINSNAATKEEILTILYNNFLNQ